MRAAIKLVLARILKRYFQNRIAVKAYNGTKSLLYYEESQHLMFAFKSRLSYEPTIQGKIKKYIHEVGLVFDIGGNIGQYTLLFSDLVGEKGKVVTIEPDYKNFSFLQFNVNVNNLSNVVCLKKGISDTPGVVEFYRDTETGGRKGSFERAFVHQNFKGFTEKVETTTLDSLIEEYGCPHFVKVDVEGFEAKVINGLTKQLKNTVFLVEVREETKQEVFHYFQQREYVCYHIDEEVDVEIRTPEQIPKFANLLFIRE